MMTWSMAPAGPFKAASPIRTVCIVGWSFGGYIALLGAQRNPELFRCAVDIAGVSDLGLLIDEGHDWLDGGDEKEKIGVDPEKLKRDSPHLHAADFKVPLLMLHGRMDAQVPFEQSEVMDEALKHAHVAHRFTVVPGADHQFSDVKDRATLLRETEDFLRQYLPAGAAAGRPHRSICDGQLFDLYELYCHQGRCPVRATLV